MTSFATGLPVPFLTRSWLFLPALEEAALHAGMRSGADIVAIDLTLTQSLEEPVLERIEALLGERGQSTSEPAVFLVVAADDQALEKLVERMVASKPDGIVLANPSGVRDIQRLDVLLTVAEAEHAIAPNQTRIAILADGLETLDLADCSERLIAACWSASTLMMRLGATRMHETTGALVDTFRHYRARLLGMAAAAHIEAVDCESGLISTERLLRDAREAAADGFTGKMTLAPRQAASINQAFLPDADTIREAEAIMANVLPANALQRLRAVRHLQRAALIQPQAG